MNSPRPSDHDEQRIRETAYHLWEKDGRPLGQAERYWEMAQSMAGDKDERAPAPAAPVKVSRAKKSEPKAKKASPANSKKSFEPRIGEQARH
jgi:hypothetical protein